MIATMTATSTASPGRFVHRGRTHGARGAGDRSHRAARVGARTYARRRAFVGGISATLVAVWLVAGIDVLAAGGAPASAEVVQPTGGGSVVARPGDTLWSIAEEHRGTVGIRRYVDALIDLNGGPAIQAGQRVTLP